MEEQSSGGNTDNVAGADEPDPESPGKTSMISRLFGFSNAGDEEREPNAVQVSNATESLRAQDMLVNLQNMRSLKVNDVSVPRADIVAVPVESGIDELLEVFQTNTWSRLPIYSENLDQPIGLVHLKDFALRYGFGKPTDDFDLRTLARPLLYVPPSMPIGVLLHKMQIARIHMALVIDEYGGVDGLVTIEDLLEQIVGEIADEHDEDESSLLIQESPNTYVAASRMELDDFEAETGLALAMPDKDEEVDTLGGLVFRIAGRVPERGEIVIHEDGHEFEILDADARRIKRLRVSIKTDHSTGTIAKAAE
ncbi:hemolysin family protein [Amaricoccus tamworthensis]|uniref:hemolysin family protein n=1 Tax=Amaricoccus tamworthensis TaxID=57002 RepID=UPI003C79D0E9